MQGGRSGNRNTERILQVGKAVGIMSKGCAVIFGGMALLVFGLAMVGQYQMEAYNALSPEERAAVDRETEKRMEADRRAKAERNLVEHRDGHHCLSGFSQEHWQIVRYVKDRLREPDSFEHIETAIAPVDKDGQHRLRMRYRARNGFGGMNVETDFFDVANADCSFKPI